MKYGLPTVDPIPPAILQIQDLDLSMGQIIRILAWLHGYTALEMARDIGYSLAHVSKVMQGQDAASEEFIAAIAKYLNVVPHRLDKFSARHFDRRKKEWRESRNHPKEAKAEEVAP
jgi:transcriptional regulator with XRE-family HTH domain